jgi:hypothetical protein
MEKAKISEKIHSIEEISELETCKAMKNHGWDIMYNDKLGLEKNPVWLDEAISWLCFVFRNATGKNVNWQTPYVELLRGETNYLAHVRMGDRCCARAIEDYYKNKDKKQ